MSISLKFKTAPEPKKQSPVAEAICKYMKALDESCREILSTEAANGDSYAKKLLVELDD